MLAQHHRITTPESFRAVKQAGSRASTQMLTVHLRIRSPDSAQWRAGFIVSKAVGNAVVRHRVTRRLRHISADVVERLALETATDLEVVVRAHSASSKATSAQLHDALSSALRRAHHKYRSKEEKAEI